MRSLPVVDLDAEIPHSETSLIRKVLKLVFPLSLKDRAREIRFEWRDERFRITYLIDGTLHDLVPPPEDLYRGIIAEIYDLVGGRVSPRPTRLWRRHRAPSLPDDPTFGLKLGPAFAVLRVWARPSANVADVLLEFVENGIPCADAWHAMQRICGTSENDSARALEVWMFSDSPFHASKGPEHGS